MTATASKTVSYKELGFVNTREMFKNAMKDGYAVPAYNFNNMEQLQAILTACVRSRSPVILQLSKGARDYANATLLAAPRTDSAQPLAPSTPATPKAVARAPCSKARCSSCWVPAPAQRGHSTLGPPRPDNSDPRSAPAR